MTLKLKTEIVALGAVELYKRLRSFDSEIKHLQDAYTIKVEHWPWHASGNGPTATKIADGRYCERIRSAMRAYLISERSKIVAELNAHGFGCD